jgi:hypothetical protein
LLDALTDRLHLVLDDRPACERVAGGGDALDQCIAGLVVGRLAGVGHREHRDPERHELAGFVDAGHTLFP